MAHHRQAATDYVLRSLPMAVTPSEPAKPEESREPADIYSYPQLSIKNSAQAPGQNSIGTGGQY
ncbi:MAG: hypothetical protein LW863_13580 [Flammeovirgaceae bacterium]|nr:hypothetical protein [Flammeovirgaceae bacterium]